MSDRRIHRGPHPRDRALFAPPALAQLRAATSDLSWLYGHGYAQRSSLKLVGDRYALTARQREAVARCACSERDVARRRAHRVAADALEGAVLELDGFNVLTTLEVALGGGVVLVGRDGCLRDVAGVHGSYRKVAETLPALELCRSVLQAARVARCEWLLDRPVSNSGRLCALITAFGQEHDLAWTARTVADPDRLLIESAQVVISSDGRVLDRAARSFNLLRACLDAYARPVFLVDLSEATE